MMFAGGDAMSKATIAERKQVAKFVEAIARSEGLPPRERAAEVERLVSRARDAGVIARRAPRALAGDLDRALAQLQEQLRRRDGDPELVDDLLDLARSLTRALR